MKRKLSSNKHQHIFNFTNQQKSNLAALQYEFHYISTRISNQGKTAIITGGTKHLGGETARELAKLGANLFLHYRLDANQAETFKQELTKEFPDLKLKFMVVNWIKLKI